MLQLPEIKLEVEEPQETNNTPNNTDTFLPTAIPTRKRKKTEERRTDKSTNNLNSNASTSQNNDESQDFGNLVAKKLRKYDNLTQCAIQNAIMVIFLNADKGFYEYNHEPPTPFNYLHCQLDTPPKNTDQQCQSSDMYTHNPNNTISPSHSPTRENDDNPHSQDAECDNGLDRKSNSSTPPPDTTSDEEFSLNDLI